MDSQKPVMLRLIACSVSVASKAGAEVRRILQTGKLDVVDKGVQDYQTEADRTAQRMIVATLAKSFPKCTIVGEEKLEEDLEADEKLVSTSYDESILVSSLPTKYNAIKEEDITIWVDPLDGTAEFVKGHLDHVTVLIGLSVSGKAIAGVVHQPFYGYKSGMDKVTGRTMWGLVDHGCFGVERKQNLEDKFVVTTTASHGNKDIEDSLKSLGADSILKVGGAGHKVLLVIEGTANAYVFASNGCKRWDTCAPEALLKSLGGRLTDICGNDIEYSYRADENYQNYLGVVASSDSSVHSRIIKNIPQDIKERLEAAQLKSKF